MNISEWRFNRALRLAQKRFRKLAEETERLRMGKGERRNIFKRLIWGAGFKRVRMIEK